MTSPKISSPDHPALAELCGKLAELARETDLTNCWPAEQLRLCGEYGVFEWFLEPEWGGRGWDAESVVRGYHQLSQVDLTTTFIITQRSGACRRIETSDNFTLKQELLPPLAEGSSFATVGISHLTTSRRHLATPVLRAEQIEGGFLLDGYSPWVTGAAYAEHIVVGATIVQGGQPTKREILVVLPTDLPGVHVPEPAQLVGLTASATGQVQCDAVRVDERWLLAGPREDVMAQGSGAGTGGYQTSTLALGLAKAAIDFIRQESERRDELGEPLSALEADYQSTYDQLFAVVRGEPACSADLLRQRANSIVLRATQAALVAAKGAGYIQGHPVGRWCREALFFLVWSCPQGVVSANLCELAGIAE